MTSSGASKGHGALLALGLLLGSAAACAEAEPAAERAGCVNAFDPERDYYPAKAELRHARGFAVSYHGHYKVLSLRGPSGGTDIVVLVQCGAPAPPLDDDLAGATVIEIPARTLGANADLALNRARALGYADRIVAMGGGGVYAPELRARWESGAAVAIGESFHGQPDFEKLLTAAPDVVFLSTASLERAGSLERARALGLPAVPTLSWVEPTALGQAEWMQLVAIVLNAEEEANVLLAGIEERYVRLSSAARAEPTRPLIVWLDPGDQRDHWVVPEGDWIAGLIDDAGGRTPWSDANGPPTRTVTTEDILALGDTIDAVVTTTVALGEPGALGALETLPAVREGRLYDVHRRSRPEHDAYDWYEGAVVDVDEVLADMVALLHPDLLAERRFHHLRAVRSGGGADDGRE